MPSMSQWLCSAEQAVRVTGPSLAGGVNSTFRPDPLTLPALAIALGLPVPAREAAAYVTRARGGYGAVREAAELILKAQGKWDKILSKI